MYYKKLPNGTFVLLLLYVDDMLVTGSKIKLMDELKQRLAQRFGVKDLGAARQTLGMTIIQDRQRKR